MPERNLWKDKEVFSPLEEFYKINVEAQFQTIVLK